MIGWFAWFTYIWLLTTQDFHSPYAFGLRTWVVYLPTWMVGLYGLHLLVCKGLPTWMVGLCGLLTFGWFVWFTYIWLVTNQDFQKPHASCHLCSVPSVRSIFVLDFQVANRHLEVIWMCSGEVACVVRESQDRTKGWEGVTDSRTQGSLGKGGSGKGWEFVVFFLLNHLKPGDSIRDLFIS